jgi:hypothetical protein
MNRMLVSLLLIVISSVFPMGCEFEQNFKFLEWTRYFCKPDAKLTLDKQRELTVFSEGIRSIDTSNMLGSRTRRYFIYFALSYDVQLVGKSIVVDESYHPDSEIELYDLQKKCNYKILFFGPSGIVHDVFWLDDETFIILGQDSGFGIIECVDIKRNAIQCFRIDKAYMKNIKPAKYLIYTFKDRLYLFD